MYQVSAWLMERSGGNSSSNPLQTKATQQASKPSKAKQSKSKAIGLGDQGNMLIVKESNKIINK